MLRHPNRAELLARAGNTDGDIETADGMAKGQKRRLKAKRKIDQRANVQLPKMAELEKENGDSKKRTRASLTRTTPCHLDQTLVLGDDSEYKNSPLNESSENEKEMKEEEFLSGDEEQPPLGNLSMDEIESLASN
ncbi:MAG: hypothetical protein Q9161_004889 [Pseudevernia consocians]